MALKSKKTCYMCGEIATSKEHVPPKSLFLEKNDFPGKDYRKNLITVPSCDLHNNEKSKDDQYLFLVISMLYEGYPLAQELFHTKGMRSIRRKPNLLSKLELDITPVNFHGQETGGFNLNKERFNRVSDKMARALYFHHTGNKLFKPLGLFYSFGFPNINSPNFLSGLNTNRTFFDAVTKELKNHPKLGDNPAIFYFQISEIETNEFILIRLVFFDNINIVAYHSLKFMDFISKSI